MLATLQALVRRIRQHHAIEHATLTILAERFPGRRMVGYSDPMGVTLWTDLPEAAVQRALDHLGEYATTLRVLGSYARDQA